MFCSFDCTFFLWLGFAGIKLFISLCFGYPLFITDFIIHCFINLSILQDYIFLHIALSHFVHSEYFQPLPCDLNCKSSILKLIFRLPWVKIYNDNWNAFQWQDFTEFTSEKVLLHFWFMAIYPSSKKNLNEYKKNIYIYTKIMKYYFFHFCHQEYKNI